MYCVKCGVELAESESKCPLCKTPVYYPEAKRGELNFPEFKNSKEPLNLRGLTFVITFFFIIGAAVSVICNNTVSGKISWAYYVIASLALAYVLIVLPMWFRRPSPIIFIPVDFFAIAVFLMCVSFLSGGKWFFSFALPITAFVALLVSGITILSYYIRKAYLYIWGGAFILLGGFMPLLELFIHWNFKVHDSIMWSFYPFVAFILFGVMLIVVAIVKPFKESLKRVFHL